MAISTKPLSVTQLLDLLKASMVRAFPSLCVVGEVVDPFLSRNGHLYLRLRDHQGELRVVMWRREAQRLRTLPEAGDRVVARGSLTVFPSKGELQFQALALAREGVGDKLVSLAELKEKLKNEGLFDRPKRAIPLFPHRIGVVTSLGGAVLHDIFQSVRRRNPAAELWLSPAPVSGPEAPTALAEALDHLQGRADVVILARGGGSFEELQAFSDEALVRKVAAFPLPVIAAIGHGSDSTLLDLVADATAATPTAAAELATPVRSELLRAHALLRRSAQSAIERRLRNHRQEIQGLARLCQQSSPKARIQRDRAQAEEAKVRLRQGVESQLRRYRDTNTALARRLHAFPWDILLTSRQNELASLTHRLHQSMVSKIRTERNRLQQLALSCQSLGPEAVLSRGFALMLRDGRPVTTAQGRMPGEELELLLADGRLRVTVNSVTLSPVEEPS